MRHWLPRDAGYTVTDTVFLQHYSRTLAFGYLEKEMKALFACHFQLIETVDELPYNPYAVCQRTINARN